MNCPSRYRYSTTGKLLRITYLIGLAFLHSAPRASFGANGPAFRVTSATILRLSDSALQGISAICASKLLRRATASTTIQGPFWTPVEPAPEWLAAVLRTLSVRSHLATQVRTEALHSQTCAPKIGLATQFAIRCVVCYVFGNLYVRILGGFPTLDHV
jgi:hypothetical protein